MNRIENMVVYFALSFMFLQACSKHRSAPVEDLSNSTHKKNSNNSHLKKKYNRDYVIVKKGDTLYSIGFVNNMDYKKLAILNNIKPPYRIFPGQEIKLQGLVTVLTKTSDNASIKTPINKPNSTKNQTTTYPLKKPTTQNSKAVTIEPVKTNSPKQPITNTVVKQSPEPISPTPKTPVDTQTKTPPTSNTEWIWPVKGNILSSFSSSDTSRKGIKIAVNYDSPVYASNHGTVVYSGDGLRGYGELIIIKHSDNLLSAYAHNSKRFVKEGEAVNQGQEIAKSGKGNDGKALLHFEIRKNGQPINPVIYLPK